MGLIQGKCPLCGAFLIFSDKKNTIKCKYCKKELSTDKAQKLYKSTIKDIDKKFTEFQSITDEINKNLNRLCSYKVRVTMEKYALEKALYKTFNLQGVAAGSESIGFLEGITDTGIFVFKNTIDETMYCQSLLKEFNKDILNKLLKEYESSCDEALLKIDKKIASRNRKAVLKIFLLIIRVIIVFLINFFLFKTGHTIFGILCIFITIWITLVSYVNISDHISDIVKKR